MIADWFEYFVGMIPSLVTFLDSWEVITGVSVLSVIVAAIIAGVITNTLYNRGTL